MERCSALDEMLSDELARIDTMNFYNVILTPKCELFVFKCT